MAVSSDEAHALGRVPSDLFRHSQSGNAREDLFTGTGTIPG